MCYSSVVEPVAEWLDEQLWIILESATEIVLRSNRSLQDWVVRQLGGYGFRSFLDTVNPAFIGALEQAVPTLCGENGVCPQLADILGGEDYFGEDAPGESRWRVMSRGGELKRVWTKMKLEEVQSATWLAGLASRCRARRS